MRICIYGAGAIGGFLGGRLAAAGEDVTLIARGPHLAAIQEHGLVLREAGGERSIPVAATDDPGSAGIQDYVIVTLKAHQGPGVAAAMQPLLGPETAVVTAVNGIPWWYFHALDGPWRDRRLHSVDPGDRQWDLIGPARAIGCVVYPACIVPAPGVIEHLAGDRFVLGEPDGSRTERIMALSRAMIGAGLKAPVRPRIRDEIWVKLWGNLSFNPISALTRGTLDVVATGPETRSVARGMMLEAQAIGEALGVRFGVDVEQRIDGAAAVGPHRTSMLQDLERGRPMEIDALVTVVQEIGGMVGVATPVIDTVLALVQALGRGAGCYTGDTGNHGNTAGK